MRRSALLPVVTLLATGSAFAGGDIADGNARFRIGVSNVIGSFAIPFTAPNGEGELITDAGGVDQIQRNLWYFRSTQQGTGLFCRLNTPNESYTGNQGLLRFTQALGTRYFAYNDPVATGSILNPQVYIDVVYTATVQDFGTPNTVKVIQRIDFTNNNTFVVTAKAYNVLGPSLGGPGDVGDDVVSFVAGDPTSVRFQDPDATWEFRGFGAARGQGGEARTAGLYGLFPTSGAGTTSVDNLSNGIQGGLASFGPSTFGVAGAIQFDISLAPGATQTIFTVIGVNTPATLPVGCTVDFNEDGFLNQEDLGGYLGAFLDESLPAGPSGTSVAPCPGEPAPYDTAGYAADFNRDCAVNQEDLGGYITEYLTQTENPDGCLPG